MGSRSNKELYEAELAKKKHARQAKSLGQARREMKAETEAAKKEGRKPNYKKAIKRHQKRVWDDVAYS